MLLNVGDSVTTDHISPAGMRLAPLHTSSPVNVLYQAPSPGTPPLPDTWLAEDSVLGTSTLSAPGAASQHWLDDAL